MFRLVYTDDLMMSIILNRITLITSTSFSGSRGAQAPDARPTEGPLAVDGGAMG